MLISLLCLTLLLAVQSDQGTPTKEMDVRKPKTVILPPPPLLDTAVKDGVLTVRFREIGIERVQAYNVYKLEDGKWQLLGSAKASPMQMTNCTTETANYGLAAVDSSRTEGARSRFTDRSCSKFVEKR